MKYCWLEASWEDSFYNRGLSNPLWKGLDSIQVLEAEIRQNPAESLTGMRHSGTLN